MYEEIIQHKSIGLLSNEQPLILAIESSCDETSAAVMQGKKVLSLVISSQIDIHRRFGGVVPEVASRNHTLSVNQVAEQAISEAKIKFSNLEAIAVTYGAGLLGALLVGVSYAKALSFSLNIPLVKVNHIRGHIAANYIEHDDLKPPYICLVVSGGHTSIIEVKSYTEYQTIGSTVDDACGEAFDKVARVLNLPYPGGPEIDKLAKQGIATIEFPKMMKNQDNFNFSYSGLKTSVINYIHTKRQKNEEFSIENLCASFQAAALDILVEKAVSACKKYGYHTLTLAGGVSANSYLRKIVLEAGKQNNLKICIPSLIYCTDNAAMIGCEAFLNLREGKSIANLSLNANASLRF